jgi:hypothetical protein
MKKKSGFIELSFLYCVAVTAAAILVMGSNNKHTHHWGPALPVGDGRLYHECQIQTCKRIEFQEVSIIHWTETSWPSDRGL